MTNHDKPRRFQIVRCLKCDHEWDDHDPDAEVCACLDIFGYREVIQVREGWTVGISHSQGGNHDPFLDAETRAIS